MKKIKAAQALVETIKSWGLTHVFGLPGTGIMDIYDAFYDTSDIRLITTRHEQGAGHMAEGYARITGKPGVCLVARAAGAANAVIAAVNAYSESWPVIILAGEPGTDILGKEAFEEVDLVSMYRPITKWAARVLRADRLVEFMTTAYREAISGRCRPVLLTIPQDLQTQEIEFPDSPSVPLPFPTPPRPSKEGMEQVLKALDNAIFPLVIAGGGVVRARATDMLAELAELLSLPVVTTFARNDAFPNNHPSYLGVLDASSLPTTSKALTKADLILALGCRFSELATNRFTRPMPRLIHVDIDPHELGKVYRPDICLIADATAFLTDILEMAKGEAGLSVDLVRRRRAILRELRAEFQLACSPPVKGSSRGVHPSQIAAALGEVQRGNEVFVADCATFQGWINRYVPFSRAGTFLGGAGGSVGVGFPCALGAKLGRPEAPVFCLVGDGSFLMNVQELETAVRYQIGVLTIVLNNFSYGNVKVKQASHYQGRIIGSDLSNPDFAQLANLFGAHGVRVESAEQLRPAIDECLARSGPSVIDVIMDSEDLAPPGTTFFTPAGSFQAT